MRTTLVAAGGCPRCSWIGPTRRGWGRKYRSVRDARRHAGVCEARMTDNTHDHQREPNRQNGGE